jgi:hypothetical protein
MQPLVKLHGTRLKLLAGAVGPATASDSASRCPAGGALQQLLEVLQLASTCCFEPQLALQLQQQHLPQLQQALAAAGCTTEQGQQLLTGVLQPALRQHWQAQDTAGSQLSLDTAAAVAAAPGTAATGMPGQLQLWLEAVLLLVEDSCTALRFAQDCYSKPLGPACYSLARGLYRLGRYEQGGHSRAVMCLSSTPQCASHVTCPRTSSPSQAAARAGCSGSYVPACRQASRCRCFRPHRWRALLLLRSKSSSSRAWSTAVGLPAGSTRAAGAFHQLPGG